MSRRICSTITTGAVEGVEVGTRFETRHKLMLRGVHGHMTKRFHFIKGFMNSVIVVPQDLDVGRVITVRINCATVREPPEIKAFLANQRQFVPVRVVRSHLRTGQYSPLVGYRYDGLYMVTNVCDVVEDQILKWYVELEREDGQPVVWDEPPFPRILPRLSSRPCAA